MGKIHLLVLIHGMWGNPDHLAEMNRIIKEVKGSTPAEDDGSVLEVLLASANKDECTYDGVDWCGERVVDEIEAKIEELAKDDGIVTKFSITGYSLGGLVARYVIGALHQREFFKNVKPVNFNTFATLHIGLIRYSTFFSKLTHTLGPILLSRSGEQFYAVDKWAATGKPLVAVMADPTRVFYQALLLFPNICIYANAVNDVTVPYPTASINVEEDPFADRAQTGLKVIFDEKYEPLVKSYVIPDVPPAKKKTRPLSKSWFASFKPSRILPPRLQFGFPLNIVLFVFLPVVIPSFIVLVIVRLSLHSRSSRARIKLLEKEHSRAKLVNIFARLERDIEGTVMDMSEEAPTTPMTSPPTSGVVTPEEKMPSSFSTISSPSGNADASHANGQSSLQSVKKSSGRPAFTELQLEMAASLNRIPQLKKQAAFIDPIRNSHATIICRDVVNFPFHRRGEGILRHWADHFVL